VFSWFIVCLVYRGDETFVAGIRTQWSSWMCYCCHKNPTSGKVVKCIRSSII